MKALLVNPGATSTKLAIYDGLNAEWSFRINHGSAWLEKTPAESLSLTKNDSWDMRLEQIRHVLCEAYPSAPKIGLVIGRGGLLRPVQAAVYEVNATVLEDAKQGRAGAHPANYGVLIAAALAEDYACKAYFLDPVSTDELLPEARLSGLDGVERQSLFHALNQKAVARLLAAKLGRDYKELRLIVAHLGGGISCAAHLGGRAVDVTNVRDEGCFSMDRAGGLPLSAAIGLCFQEKDEAALRSRLMHQAGFYSYLGSTDYVEIEARAAAGETKAALVLKAFEHQFCKDVGAMAAVLDFRVDAIVLTGGLIQSEHLRKQLTARLQALAPVICYPGEYEMEAMAEAACGIMNKTVEVMTYTGGGEHK